MAFRPQHRQYLQLVTAILIVRAHQEYHLTNLAMKTTEVSLHHQGSSPPPTRALPPPWKWSLGPWPPAERTQRAGSQAHLAKRTTQTALLDSSVLRHWVLLRVHHSWGPPQVLHFPDLLHMHLLFFDNWTKIRGGSSVQRSPKLFQKQTSEDWMKKLSDFYRRIFKMPEDCYFTNMVSLMYVFPYRSQFLSALFDKSASIFVITRRQTTGWGKSALTKMDSSQKNNLRRGFEEQGSTLSSISGFWPKIGQSVWSV